MTDVNLLPWREWQRGRDVRRLQYGLLAALVTGALMTMVMAVWLDGRLGVQLQESVLLDEQIASLHAALTEVEALNARNADLVEQQRELQALASQPASTLLGRLMYLVPDQVWLDSLQFTRQELRLTGLARSGPDVAQLLRNLGAEPGVGKANLNEVKSTIAGERFQLSLTLQESS